MKTRVAVIALVLILCSSVFAVDRPEIDIPVFPNGEVTMEINLSQEDLLPTLQAMLPMLKIGGPQGAISPEDIAAVLKDVKQIEMIQVEIARNVTDTEVAEFYAKNVPAGQWSRVFWQKSPKSGTLAVYVQGNGERLYAYRVQPTVIDDKPAKRVQIVKTDGKIDFAKLLTLASKFFGM